MALRQQRSVRLHSAMPGLPYLNHEQTRHGKLIFVVRVGKGPRTRLREDYDPPEFLAAYNAAIANPAAVKPRKPVAGTLKWLWDLYRASPAWLGLSQATKNSAGSCVPSWNGTATRR
jgi:hypothetical protein